MECQVFIPPIVMNKKRYREMKKLRRQKKIIKCYTYNMTVVKIKVYCL
jgi:hypothetical protein